jgi:hypothetical protein
MKHEHHIISQVDDDVQKPQTLTLHELMAKKSAAGAAAAAEAAAT